MVGQENAGARRFACTACGVCCNRGPEMELGETAALAGRFICRLLFKVHSLPLHERGRRADLWGQGQKSGLPLAAALDESRAHVRRFAAHEEIDKAHGRSLHLSISALTVDADEGRCPALEDRGCGIYASRPLACRSVPFHYSRPVSTLAGYLDEFTGVPARACDTSEAAPVVLSGDSVLDVSMREARAGALAMGDSDRAWKAEIARLMLSSAAADAGLPSYRTVVENSDRGVASLVPMLPAWRIAVRVGLLSSAAFNRICRDQIALLKRDLERATAPMAPPLQSMLLDYELELAKAGGPVLADALNAALRSARPSSGPSPLWSRGN